jgi:hypothetical protein
METEDLLAAIPIHDIGFDRPAAHRSDGCKWITLAEQVPAGRKWSDMLDKNVQLPERGLVHAFGQAGLRESTGRTEVELVAVIGDRG